MYGVKYVTIKKQLNKIKTLLTLKYLVESCKFIVTDMHLIKLWWFVLSACYSIVISISFAPNNAIYMLPLIYKYI